MYCRHTAVLTHVKQLSGIFNGISIKDKILTIYFFKHDRCTGLVLSLVELWVLCSTTSCCSHACVALLKEWPYSKAVDPLKLRDSRIRGASLSSSKHKLYKQTVRKGWHSHLYHLTMHECFTTLCAHIYTRFILTPSEPGCVETSPTSPSPHFFRLHDLE